MLRVIDLLQKQLGTNLKQTVLFLQTQRNENALCANHPFFPNERRNLRGGKNQPSKRRQPGRRPQSLARLPARVPLRLKPLG